MNNARRGNPDGNDLVGRLSHMLLTLDLYTSLFEPAFLHDSTRFFTQEGNRYISHYSIAQFFSLVDFRLSEATEFVSKYLSTQTKRPLVEIVEQYLLKPHVAILLESGFQTLLEEQKVEDVRRVAILCDRVGLSESVKLYWCTYIK